SASTGAQATANLTLTSMYTYSGQVNATCDASALGGATCSLSPSNPVAIASTATVPVTATVTVPASAAAGNYNIVVSTADTTGAPSHSLTIPLTVTKSVQDFGFGTPSPAAQTITAGQQAAYSYNVSPVGSSFPNGINFSCSGLPSMSQCNFTPNPATPGSSAVAVTMTIATTARSSSTRHLLNK